MLGGSASHNGMVHMRGSPKDYDNWAILLNDNSFEYTNVLKYFRKMETFNGPTVGSEGDGNWKSQNIDLLTGSTHVRTQSIEYYGHDGPIVVNTNDIPMIDLWLEAGKELEYNIGDPNGFQREGKIYL